MDSLLTPLLESQYFNGNVLLAEKGKVVYTKCLGYANLETQQKLTENTVFELASVSKQFTAFAIVLLQEKGKLSLEDNISKYLPEMKAYSKVTIRNLLNHTGGLPDYMEFMDSLWDKSKIAVNQDVLNLFAKHSFPAMFEPNTKYEYSNTGYALLASIIEKASGKSYADFMKQEIFTPLGMQRTFIYNRRLKPQQVADYALGYVWDEKAERYVIPDSLEAARMAVWLDGVVGDGTVNSTIHDLFKWDRALYSNSLVSKKGIQEIFSPAILKSGEKSEYGFGWVLEKHSQYGRIVNHGGSWLGYITWIDRHLDSDKTIIVLQNESEVKLPIKNIRHILYNEPIPAKPKRTEVVVSQEIMKQYVGEYEFEPNAKITITASDSGLKAQLTGQQAFPIFAENDTAFFFKVVDAQIVFVLDPNKRVAELILKQGGAEIKAKKIR